MDSALQSLIESSWRLYRQAENQAFLVRPSIPILYFGNRTQYLNSPCRVITVGLNPSRTEFPPGDRFARFSRAAIVNSGPPQPDYHLHLEALDAYFRTKPYGRWFNAYEILLRGLDCSFYEGRTNTALHTDLCSPLATEPTWSRLTRDQKSTLDLEGVKLWHALVEYLGPDLILISVATRYLSRIEFPQASPWQVLYTVRRKNPYEVKGRQLCLNASKHAWLIFGRAANTPFGTISNEDKLEIGARLKKLLPC